MPVKHIRGNLLKSNCDVIAHGCNCFNTMGAGIARQIKRAYPYAFNIDNVTARGDRNKLGSLSAAKDPRGELPKVYNLYTQYRYGRRGSHVDYAAVQSSLTKMKKSLDLDDPEMTLKVGMPRIGCGLAGGLWPIVEGIINSIFTKRTICIYTL